MAQVNAGTSLPDESRPLSGRRIVVTRARSQASSFVEALKRLGAEAIEFPTIEIVPPASYEALDRAIQNLQQYDWIIFTSVNGVSCFSDRLAHLKIHASGLGKIRAAAIGPETAKALESLGVRPRVVPEEFRAEAILEMLRPEEMRGRKVLIPRAAEARDVLIQTLRQWGAQVDVVEAYRTIVPKNASNWMRALLLGGKADMVTFTSSSTVKNFVALLGADDVKGLLSATAIACIGPITQATAEELGVRVDAIAAEYTIPGLTRAIVEYFANAKGKGGRDKV
ncbi:MAG TPA: uroporphyrinogen-III synthase [Candidatus Binatia bacterium]|jgi:uroporphyrinogen III methyltransferase/synthase